MLKQKKKLRGKLLFPALIGIQCLNIPNVYAAEKDPLQVINNLSNLMASIITTFGGIVLMFGIVQIGLSFNSHDPSQRVSGVMTFVAGVILTCSKAIVDRIT